MSIREFGVRKYVTAVISGTIQSVQAYHHIFTKHFKVTTGAGYAFNAAYQTSQLHFSKPKNVLKYRTDLTPLMTALLSCRLTL